MVTPHKTKVHEQSPELRWLGSRPAELRAYENQWVAIRGEAVIAFGDKPLDVIEQVLVGDRSSSLLAWITRSDFDSDTYFVG